VGAPTITSLSFADVSIAVNGSTTLTAVFSNGTAVLTPGNITLTSGVGVTVSPSSTEEYTVTVTNQAGNTSYATRVLVVTTGQMTATVNNTTGDRQRGSTAIKLNSGKVLILGSSYNYNSTVDLFDPTTNSFSVTGSLNQGRGNVQAVVLQDGRVLLAGGEYYNGQYISLATTEIYNPNTETFTLTGSLNTARRSFKMFLLANGNVLAIGGYNHTGGSIKTTEIYNPNTGLWSYGPSMTYARDTPIAVKLGNGKILVAGGYNSTNGYLQKAELYDPTTNTFTLLADQMNIGRYDAAAIATPTGAIIVGGLKFGVSQATIEIFRTDTSSFDDNVPSLFYPSFGFNIHQRSDGMLVYFGGSTGTFVLTEGYLIDPETFAIVPENVDLSRYRYYYGSVTLLDGRILFVGGNSSAGTTADIYSY
jgi:N-acetylneuraminic acid mutarotase